MVKFTVPDNWQSELSSFRETEEGQEFFRTGEGPPKYRAIVKPPVPAEAVLELAELCLNRQELIDAMNEWEKWGEFDEAYQENPKDPKIPPYPREQVDLLDLFADWYSMTKMDDYNPYGIRCGISLAMSVLVGEFSNLRSTEAAEWMSQRPGIKPQKI